MKTLQTLILIEWDWKRLTQEGYLSWWGFYKSISQGESDNISSRECLTCSKDMQSHKPLGAWSNCTKQKVRQHQGQTTIKPVIRTLWLLLTSPSICQSGGNKGGRETAWSRNEQGHWVYINSFPTAGFLVWFKPKTKCYKLGRWWKKCLFRLN